MQKEMIVYFSGWCVVHPQTKLENQKTGELKTAQEIIDSQDNIEDYLLEDTIATIRDSVDYGWESLDIKIQ